MPHIPRLKSGKYGLETRCSDSENQNFPHLATLLVQHSLADFLLEDFLNYPLQVGQACHRYLPLPTVYTQLPISFLKPAFPAVSPNSVNDKPTFLPPCASKQGGIPFAYTCI